MASRSDMTSYQSILTPTENIALSHSPNRRRALIASITVAVLVGNFFLLDHSGGSAIQTKITGTSSIRPADPTRMKMPSGVNFGSWLTLEDYFFASKAAVEVATPDGKTVGSCLPPLHTDASTSPRWNSETDLLARLTKQTSLAHALRAFQAYRVSFIDFEDDLAALAALGIKFVRVPMSWCLTDEDPTEIDNDEDEDSLAEKYTCADPFFGDDVRWPAVSRDFIATFLRACAKHGIGATLDVHTYPGGTSIGTFSGVWPRWPRFWTHGDQPGSPTLDAGRGLLRDLIQWLESLAETDPDAFEGFRAISPMNEPAHLAGQFRPNGPIDKENFLPPLPTKMAQDYLEELAPPSEGGMHNYTSVPDGPHLRVMMWLRDAVNAFRESSLPSKGKELHLNIIEFMLAEEDLPKFKYANYHVIGSWWRATTSPKERSSWAVLDMHHYHAWDPTCSGAVDGPPKGNYTCGDTVARDATFERCMLWATSSYRASIEKECGRGARLASAEFSAGTNHQVRHACNDASSLRATYLAQLEAAEEANVETFFWSYKMPYGGAFRNAWSFKHLMYLLGVTALPDESPFGCGDHVPLEGEPTDDVFFIDDDNGSKVRN